MAQMGYSFQPDFSSERSDLEKAKVELKAHIDRRNEVEEKIYQLRLQICMAQMGYSFQPDFSSERSDLEKAKVELKAHIDSMAQERTSFLMEYEKDRSALETTKKEFKSLFKRMDELDEKIQKTLDMCMAEMGTPVQLESENESMAQERTSFLMEYEKDRSALETTKKEFKSLFKRMDELDEKIKKNLDMCMAEMGTPVQLESENESSKQSGSRFFSLIPLPNWTGFHSKRSNPKLEEKEEELKLLKERIGKMHAENEQISKQLEESKKEFHSFKDRVAEEVVLPINSENTVRMNNPFSKSRLREMYVELGNQWHKIKKHMKSTGTNSKMVRSLIERQFEEAQKEMEQKKVALNKVFELNELKGGPIPQKITEYKQSTIMNLQLLLFHSRKDGLFLKTFFSGGEQKRPEDVWRYLASDCYWLGCLMALNNPPLQPCWRTHDPGWDSWNIFPQDLEALSAV